jgi:hypothetical protein
VSAAYERSVYTVYECSMRVQYASAVCECSVYLIHRSELDRVVLEGRFVQQRDSEYSV